MTARIKILFSDRVRDHRLRSGWGVSYLIDDEILFDTGESGPGLIRNMEYLGCDIRALRMIVISHDHWDHTGGLWDVLERRSGITVCGCPGFSDELKDRIRVKGARYRDLRDLTRLRDDVYSSGEIIGTYKSRPISEQSLALLTSGGLSIVSGCAHPGIERIVRKLSGRFPDQPVRTVIGGFHLKDASSRIIRQTFRALEPYRITRIGPFHCSGAQAEAYALRTYGKSFVSLRAGDSLDV